MLGFDRRAARYTLTAAAVLLLIWLLYQIRATVFIFILAVLFAYLLSPLVDLLDRFLPTRTRTPALTLAYVIFVGAVGMGGYEIGSRVVEQANRLATDLPRNIERWKTPASGNTGVIGRYRIQIIERAQAEIATRSSDLISELPQASMRFLSVASSLLYVVIIPILAFFFLKNGREIRRSIVEFVEEGPRRALLDDVLIDLDVLLAQYMRALLVLALATLVFYGAFFFIMGVPYAILLASLAAALEIIPMIGPLSAGAIIMLVSIVSGSHPIAVLVFMLVYRMFQDYVLQPHLMSRGVELHPLLVIFGVFAGGEIAGIPATFLSVPVLALVRIVFVRLRKARLGLAPVARSS